MKEFQAIKKYIDPLAKEGVALSEKLQHTVFSFLEDNADFHENDDVITVANIVLQGLLAEHIFCTVKDEFQDECLKLFFDSVKHKISQIAERENQTKESHD